MKDKNTRALWKSYLKYLRRILILPESPFFYRLWALTGWTLYDIICWCAGRPLNFRQKRAVKGAGFYKAVIYRQAAWAGTREDRYDHSTGRWFRQRYRKITQGFIPLLPWASCIYEYWQIYRGDDGTFCTLYWVEGRALLYPGTDLRYCVYGYSNHYIQVHTTSCVVRPYMSFEAFFPMLAPYSNFLWCCRNCMVNMDYIESFGQKEFLLKSGERIPISAARRRETVQKMQDGTFPSSKRKNQKGIGISSVLSISEKYNGIVRIEYQEQIFKISVIISQNP